MNFGKPEVRALARASRVHKRQVPNHVLNEATPSEVLDSLVDESRLCPMLAGTAIVQGMRLTVRSATRETEVMASSALLRRVVNLCDGTRTIAEVLERVDGSAARTEFREFVRFLLAEGALIDASLATATASRYAFQGSPFGLAAPPSVTDQICRRFLWNHESATTKPPPGTATVGPVPMDPLFDARVSTYTFDTTDVAADALLALVWSMAGVVRIEHERVGLAMPKRTVASAGGMQLVKVYLALQRRVGGYAPGVYRVEYLSQRTVTLSRIGDDHELLPRAFGKPWELTYATGAVFLAADPAIASARYRNRALQYLFMEAGAMLHNGGLSAPQLGLGYATIGGYYESIISKLCRLDGELVLGSAIFGPQPTAEQVRLINRSPDIDFAWVDNASALFVMPFHLARAKLKTSDDDRPHTWGRDVDPKLACLKAVAEAVEREGFREPRGIVEQSLAALPSAIDPRQFVRYSSPQYMLDGFPYQPFDTGHVYPWAAGTELKRGSEVHVLAELVFSRNSLINAGYPTRRPYTQVTSSGCAAGTSKDDAILRALLEVVERDAFMRHWLAQHPGVPVAKRRLPSSLLKRMEVLEDAGCRMVVQQLDSAWAHVCMISAQHEEKHFTTMGTAASADFLAALAGALDELEARVYAWIHGHQPQVGSADQVETTEHHFELYGMKRYFRGADTVLFPVQNEGAPKRLPASLRFSTSNELVDRFARRGIDPIAVDITPKQCFIDQGRRPLTVVKALVPGLLPISFGHEREPRGMVVRVHPKSRFPHPFP